MTRLSSSQQINAQTSNSSNNTVTTNASKWSTANIKVSSGGVTVTTISPPRIQRPLSQGPLTLIANHTNQVITFQSMYSINHFGSIGNFITHTHGIWLFIVN